MSYDPIVQKPVDKANDDRVFHSAMDIAFRNAKASDVEEFKKFKIETLDDYYRYMNDFLKWVPTEENPAGNVYSHLCMSYFIVGQFPTSFHQDSIKPGQKPPWRWLTEWNIDYAKEMGRRRVEVARVAAFGERAVFVPMESMAQGFGGAVAAGMAASMGTQAVKPSAAA